MGCRISLTFDRISFDYFMHLKNCALGFTVLLLSWSNAFAQEAGSDRLLTHLQNIISDSVPRNFQNTAELNRVAAYIQNTFEQNSDSVWLQTYTVNGKQYHNVVCSFGRQFTERLVIGAHYDVCGNQDGADDNASGVSGLLELSRLLKDQPLKCRVDLVAYTLEEPPFFRTPHMGSYVHAQYLHDKGAKVKGMISLEMIGYFSDQKRSQHYPLGILKLFYGNKGDFITVVRKMGGGKFARKTKRRMKRQGLVRTKSISAPKKLTGIDFSDHLNYWAFGFAAVMITDTSFYRNAQYHQQGDTIDRLDLDRMAKVVTQVYKVILAG